MPRRLHTGRPGWPAPLDGWAAVHQPVAEKTMTGATVEIREPGTTQQWDADTEQMVAAPRIPYWSGGARIQALNTQGRLVSAAEDPESVAGYLVAVPADVAPSEGHLIRVAACDADSALVERTLTVDQVVRGSHRFQRDLLCTLAD